MADTIWFLNHVSNNHNSEYHKSRNKGSARVEAISFCSQPCPAQQGQTQRLQSQLYSVLQLASRFRALRTHNIFATGWYWICLKTPNFYSFSVLPGWVKQGWPQCDPQCCPSAGHNSCPFHKASRFKSNMRAAVTQPDGPCWGHGPLFTLPLQRIRGLYCNLVHTKAKDEDSDMFIWPHCLINECCQKKSSSCYFEACIGSLYDDCSSAVEKKKTKGGYFCGRLLRYI